MGRPPKSVQQSAVSMPEAGKSVPNAASPDAEDVTYVPDPGDPASVKWAGRTFHANMPLQISNEKHLAKARENKWFHVGSGAPKVRVENRPEPKNQDQYRAHVAAWLPIVKSVEELDRKWESEEGLRIACGIGTEDLELLNPLVSTRRYELRGQDTAT